MPRDPGEAPARNVDIDDEKRWRLKLRDIVEVESRFNDTRKNAVFLSWRFSVHDMTSGAAVLTTADDVFELWVPSNDATYSNPDTGKVGGAREMANALLDRSLSDEEVRVMNASGIDGWKDKLLGRTLIADVEWTQTDSGYDRLGAIASGFLKTSLSHRGPYPHPTPADVGRLRSYYAQHFPEMLQV